MGEMPAGLIGAVVGRATILKTGAVSAVAAAMTGVFSSIDFKGSITLGSIIVALLVAATAAFFTIRAKIASTWREEAEAQEARGDRLQEELLAERADRQVFERQQQELRHQLKDDISGLRAQLKVEEAKHDLGALREKMQSFHAEAMSAMQANTGTAVDSVAAAISSIGDKLETSQMALLQGQEEQKAILAEILESLRRQ